MSLVRGVKCSWAQLHPAFQLKYRMSIRRELQRWALLQTGDAVPPTPLLDSQWQAVRQGKDALTHIPDFIFDDLRQFIRQNILT